MGLEKLNRRHRALPQLFCAVGYPASALFDDTTRKRCVKNGAFPRNAAGIENVDFSKIISLNPTAAYLWENVSKMESFDTDTLVELLLKEYEVEEPIAREDSRLIIERWLETGIIEE